MDSANTLPTGLVQSARAPAGADGALVLSHGSDQLKEFDGSDSLCVSGNHGSLAVHVVSL